MAIKVLLAFVTGVHSCFEIAFIKGDKPGHWNAGVQVDPTDDVLPPLSLYIPDDFLCDGCLTQKNQLIILNIEIEPSLQAIHLYVVTQGDL